MKKVIILVFLTLFTLSIFAQWGQKKSNIEYNHGLGATFCFPQLPVSDGSLAFPTFTYLPRLNVKSFSNDASLSVNVPFGVLIPGTTLTVGGTSIVYTGFYYDLGITCNFNYGIMATKASTMKIGCFGGLGFGYSPLVYDKTDYYTQKTVSSSKTMGIYVEAGFRWLGFGFKPKKRVPSTIRLYTIVGFNDALILGISFTKEFGYKGGKKSGW